MFLQKQQLEMDLKLKTGCSRLYPMQDLPNVISWDSRLCQLVCSGTFRVQKHKLKSSEPGPPRPSPATCAYDVYCFGKVLLELVTGIGKPDDGTPRDWFEHTLGYISIYDKELVTKIVDLSLIVDEDLLEGVGAVAIVAQSCLNVKSSKHSLVKYVLQALEDLLKVVRGELQFREAEKQLRLGDPPFLVVGDTAHWIIPHCSQPN